MKDIAAAFAKLASIQRSVDELLASSTGFFGATFDKAQIAPYFKSANANLAKLRSALPELYEDFQPLNDELDATGMSNSPPHLYSRVRVQQLARDVTQMLEIRAHSELEPPKTN